MARSSQRTANLTLEQLCSAKEVLVSTGSGGVGKTTTAAAIGAVAAARLGA
jgi:Mrp family chromosome partitioning ATPase